MDEKLFTFVELISTKGIFRERASYDNDSFTLTLNGVNFEDKGEYRCQAFAGDDILQMSQTISVYGKFFTAIGSRSSPQSWATAPFKGASLPLFKIKRHSRFF